MNLVRSYHILSVSRGFYDKKMLDGETKFLQGIYFFAVRVYNEYERNVLWEGDDEDLYVYGAQKDMRA